EIHPYWFTGLEFENVSLRLPTRDFDNPPAPLKIDSLSVRLSIIPLLWGSRSLSANVAIDDGDADIDFSTRKEHVSLDVDFDDLDLSKVSALADVLPLPLLGTLNGNLDVSYDKTIYEAEGEIDLTVTDATLGAADSKIKLGSWGSVSIDP